MIYADDWTFPAILTVFETCTQTDALRGNMQDAVAEEEGSDSNPNKNNNMINNNSISDTILATGVFTSAELYRLARASITTPTASIMGSLSLSGQINSHLHQHIHQSNQIHLLAQAAIEQHPQQHVIKTEHESSPSFINCSNNRENNSSSCNNNYNSNNNANSQAGPNGSSSANFSPDHHQQQQFSPQDSQQQHHQQSRHDQLNDMAVSPSNNISLNHNNSSSSSPSFGIVMTTGQADNTHPHLSHHPHKRMRRILHTTLSDPPPQTHHQQQQQSMMSVQMHPPAMYYMNAGPGSPPHVMYVTSPARNLSPSSFIPQSMQAIPSPHMTVLSSSPTGHSAPEASSPELLSLTSCPYPPVSLQMASYSYSGVQLSHEDQESQQQSSMHPQSSMTHQSFSPYMTSPTSPAAYFVPSEQSSVPND